MVGNAAMQASHDHTESITEALDRMHPELAPLRHAGGDPLYLVGGAVRDLLLGRGRTDIDLVVVGDAAALASRLGAEVVAHERFGTAKVELDGHQVDIATARSERYPRPGALPVVEPAARIEDDLGRRDFTINAMAIPVHGEPFLVDPHGGQADLASGQLRVLHRASFVDDPTRAIRAARYAARFDFALQPETAELLHKAELSTVSADRRDAELLRLAGEAKVVQAFALLDDWGLVELRPGGSKLVARTAELLDSSPWRDLVPHDRALLAAALGPAGGEEDLARTKPKRPSEGVELASRCAPTELVLARALGAEWLDRYLEEWRDIALEIDGRDLLDAGLPQGPALGRGLREALQRKLDGEIAGRDEELAVALEVARSGDGMA
jgi:tRNA nucleotidyltransferase (CCA-adding enzyme)